MRRVSMAAPRGLGGARGRAWLGTTAHVHTLDYIFHTGQVRKDVQVVLWAASWFHANICVVGVRTVAV